MCPFLACQPAPEPHTRWRSTEVFRFNKRALALLVGLILGGCGQSTEAPGAQQTRDYPALQLALGERTFHAQCANCHGWNGEGQPGWQKPGPNGQLLPPPLDDNGRTARLTRAEIKAFIRQGSPGGRSVMPAWEGKLKEEEIDALALWITSLWSDRAYGEWLRNIEHKAR